MLRLVLMYVLAIGNYINHGLKGKEIEDGVLGFRVESLPKLKLRTFLVESQRRGACPGEVAPERVVTCEE